MAHGSSNGDTTNNLWRSSSSVIVETEPLKRDRTVDLVIVGGGFTGLSAALEAARRGASVVLLEAETFGHGGSGRNVGLVNAGLWLPSAQIISLLGHKAGMRLVNALAQAPALVWSLIDREGIECEATTNGTLHVAHSPSGFRNLQERHRQGVELAAPLQLLDATETASRTGSRAFHGALFDPRAGTIQPLSYARGLAYAAINAGASLHEHTKVTRIVRQDDYWHVTANGSRVRAKAILEATNAYSQAMEHSWKPRFIAVSYCQFATAPMSETLRREILPSGEGCWDTALVMSSFRKDHAGRVIIGGVGNVEGPGAAIHAAWARRKLRQVYPQLADLPFNFTWRGRIAMTNDHIPKIIAFGPSAYACFGYSGRGIGPGTLFGKQTAIALLEGREEVLPIASMEAYSENMVMVREAYYETGAVANHLVNPPPFF